MVRPIAQQWHERRATFGKPHAPICAKYSRRPPLPPKSLRALFCLAFGAEASLRFALSPAFCTDRRFQALQDGKPDFYALQKRSLNGNAFWISLAAKSNPVQFVAYDILYYNGKDLRDFPVMERKSASPRR